MRGGEATRAERALALVAWLALWIGFAWCIGLRPAGAAYSPSLPHRLQTEALLEGTLALQPTPHGQMADWAWGNGSQHVWGLGVGLVRLPFEAAAKAFGFVGFPDRVTLLVAFIAVTLLAARAFADVRPFERVALVLMLVGTPAFAILCRTRLAVYEESVAYAHLWAVAMAIFLLCFVRRGRTRDLMLTSATGGLAILFRPTLVLDAAVTMALLVAAIAAAPARRTARIAIAGGVAGLGLAVVALVGVLRFGSPFETGQLLNVSYIPTDQAAKLFGYPYWREPFAHAAAELLSSFLLPARWNAPAWYAPDVVAWQAPTVRFREIYFTPFTRAQLVLLVAAWLGGAALAIAARRRPRLRPLVAAPVGVMLLWSATVFVGQFVFYLWAPSMTSRYAVDLAAPLAVGLAALVLTVLRAFADRRPEARVVVAALAAVWTVHDGTSAAIGGFHAQGPLLDAPRVAAVLAARPQPEPRPLPDVYRCGDEPESGGVKFNGSGWTTPGSCEVHAATMLFLPQPTCVRVVVEASIIGQRLDATATEPVRAKLGLSEMRRAADEPAGGDGRALTFCAPADHRPNPRGIELLYLGWTAPAALSPTVRPFRLLEVAEVPAP
jgi:hypothetical protein